MKPVWNGVSHRLRGSLTGASNRTVLPSPLLSSSGSFRDLHSTHKLQKATNTSDIDEFGIPTRPTWSVTSLLASYPSPPINDGTLDKLHRLSALKPPEKGSEEREVLRAEMEKLVRLVGAVRFAEVEERKPREMDGVIDGREYPLPRKMNLGRKAVITEAEGQADSSEEMRRGRQLLRHSQTANEMAYILPDLSKR